MGKNKKKLRAQRKFAQGAFIPPQSVATSTPASVLHASHKAVNAPGPVFHNYCSAKDILSRMSLGKAHPHDNWQPVVRLEYDHTATTTLESTQKRKGKNKKKIKVSNLKKKYVLRNRQKTLALNHPEKHAASSSDSGEDTPLSYLTSREDPKAKVSVANSARSSNLTKPIPPIRGALSEIIRHLKRPVLKQPEHHNCRLSVPQKPAISTPAPADGCKALEAVNTKTQEETPAPQRTLPTISEMPSKLPVLTRTSPVLPQKLPTPPRTSPVAGVPTLSNPQAPLKTTPPPPPPPASPPPPPEVITPRKRPKKPHVETLGYGTFTDTTASHNNRAKHTDDPDFELSKSCSKASTVYSMEKKIRAAKRNAVSNNKAVNTVKKRKAPQKEIILVAENVFDDFPSTSDTDPLSTNEPFTSTAPWIHSHHQVKVLSSVFEASSGLVPSYNTKVISSVDTSASGDRIPTPDNTSSPTLNESTASSELAALESGSTVASEPSTRQKQAAEDTSYFKLPQLPVFRTKYKNCPTRSMNDLRELLNIQPDKNEPICNACKRCELLSKYRKVHNKLPVSDANEPDILETTNLRGVYEFDSDDEGLKFLRRGRELVRNVLTTKRFPIWLSNLEMNLKKTMFQDEHKLGTLKRTVLFDKNDVTDAMVSKVITRVDYLNRCISEDKKELVAEKSRRRLRSAKCSSSSAGRKLLQKWAGPRRVLSPVPLNQPRGADDCRAPPPHQEAEPKPPTEGSSSPPRQASPTERHLVLCLTPLEEMLERGRESSAADVTQPNAGKSIPVRLNLNSNSEHTLNVGHGAAVLTRPLQVEIESLPLAKLRKIEQSSTSKTHDIEEYIDPSFVLYDFPSASVEGFTAQSDFEDHEPIQSIEGKQPEPPLSTQDICDKLLYRPTPEEFMDPMAYIEKIQPEASKYGICKIIPPDGFEIPYHLDDNIIFTTINQYPGRLYQRWGTTSRELTTIQAYVAMLANPRERDQFTKVPMFDGVELDLVKLYHTVLDNGGIGELLAHSEKWARIAEQMCLISPRGKPDHKKLEKLYCKHVLPYESLSLSDRLKIQEKVDRVWNERWKCALRRAYRPLHYQKRMLGETQSDDDEDLPLDPDTEEVRIIGKQCFDKTEECTGKGRTMNLATYRRIAAQIHSMRSAKGPAPTAVEVEEEYWRLLALGNEHVPVLSAFIDTSVDSLGHTSDPAGPGGSHPWNLKRLSENPRNVLSSLGKTLSVTVPTLCLNQVYSTNCWHMDPHKLAWVDVMHEGTTKIWYAVAEHDADDFRRSMQFLAPVTVQNKGIWLPSDTTMVPPALLTASGVKLQRLEQNAGEFIVVFPGAYASSIATGLTVSESVYFQKKSWLYNIDHIFQQMRLDCEPAMFSNTLLLLRMATDPKASADVLPQVRLSVRALIGDEIDARRKAFKYNCEITLDQSGRPDGGRAPISWPHQDECSICRAPLILSKTVRYNNHRSLMCVKHGLRVYSVAPAEERGARGPPVTLLYSDVELHALYRTLEQRVLKVVQPDTSERS